MITHDQAREALRILYFNIFEVDDEEYKRMNKIANVVFDYIDQQIEKEQDLNKKHYDFEYYNVVGCLKKGFHIRGFYDEIEPIYIIYFKTQKLLRITNRCFNKLIPNLEYRPSGRPCEECYVWKD